MSGGGEGRSLAEIGRDASRAAQRAALLETLEACQWCLSEAARVLAMGDGTGNVLRSIKALGLVEEYEAARRSGLIVQGRHRASNLTHDPNGSKVRPMDTSPGGNQ